MSFPAFNDLAAFSAEQQAEIDQFVSYVWGYLSAQHKDDGSHSAITADSITVAAPSAVTAGNVTGDLIPTTDRTYSLGAFPLSPANVPLTWKDVYVGSHLYLGVGSTGGVNPLTVPAWALTCGSGSVTWTPAQSGQSVVWTNAVGTIVVSIAPNALVAQLAVTGSITSTLGYFERSRTTRLGEWTDVAYAAGNFTASPGTWTVDAGDQILYRYTLIGKTMVLVFEFDTTSVSGGQSQLRFAIPGGFLAAQSQTQGGLIYNDNGAGFVSGGNIFTIAGSGFVALQPGALGVGTWAAAVNTTQVRGAITFEIQ